MWQTEQLDRTLNRFLEVSSRTLLSLFIAVILLAILAGIVWTAYDLRLILSSGFQGAFRTLLVDMLTVLAVIEVLRTALAYFSEGRVKVTYIIDTVMVTVLTEVMAFWYSDLHWEELAMVIALVLSLAVTRVVAVRFSPRRALGDL